MMMEAWAPQHQADCIDGVCCRHKVQLTTYTVHFASMLPGKGRKAGGEPPLLRRVRNLSRFNCDASRSCITVSET